MRGVLAEFGVVVAQSDVALARRLENLDGLALPASVVALLHELAMHWRSLRELIAASDARIAASARLDCRCRRLQALVGVGPLTADALVATVGDGRDFRNGRQLAAWLGLTPSQHSSSGKARLGGITCRGDGYLRMLLIQGARSSLQRANAVARERATPEQLGIRELAARPPFRKVLVAIANKHARQAWVMLARRVDHDPHARLAHPMAPRRSAATE